MAQVMLRRGRARPLWSRNPGIFPSAIQRVGGSPADGDVVEIVDHRGKFIARGLWSSLGPVRVSAFTWNPDETVDAGLIRRRVHRAVKMRRDLGAADECDGQGEDDG